MSDFELRWDGVMAGTPEQVWDGFTRHAAGWLWEISFEPRVGGAERGLTSSGGLVTAWDPARHFVTRAERPGGWWNELEYRLDPHGAGTRVRYRHATVFDDDEHEVQEAACRAHTQLYLHSLGEYVRHFAGREAMRVEADGPDRSAMAAVRDALGVPSGATAGHRVRLTPSGLDPIEGVIDWSSAQFLGIRTADAFLRVYGRDAWGWPVSVALHHFGGRVDADREGEAWRVWLDEVPVQERSAV